MSKDDQNGGRASSGSLVDSLLRRAGKVAGGTLDLAIDAAMDVSTLGSMLSDSRLRDVLVNTASPERLEAMAEAGHFLRDARETAGLSVHELARKLDLTDDSVLTDVESGNRILSMELMLRAASLLARHDPIPFFIKFLRSYNPQLEARLEQWGVMALPKNYERERRFVNLYRQHDFLRGLSDDEYQRFVEYMDSSTQLVVDVMRREREASEASINAAAGRTAKEAAKEAAKGAAKEAPAPDAGSTRRRSASTAKRKAAAKRSATSNKAATATAVPTSERPASVHTRRPAGKSAGDDAANAPRKRPVVRKVKPRNADG